VALTRAAWVRALSKAASALGSTATLAADLTDLVTAQVSYCLEHCSVLQPADLP